MEVSNGSAQQVHGDEEIWVDPFRCRMWSLHDRIEDYLNEATCRAEIQSFLKHGQLVPVLGRRLQGDARHEVELIYGARRLFIARHVNRPLRVQLRKLSERDALVAMHIENQHRQDVSPYERGMSYARWLRGGQFRSQDEIARALQVSPSQVSKLLRISRLPSVVVGAFGSPVAICEGWGLDLAEALDDPARRPVVLRRAREVASMRQRPSPREVFERLVSTAHRTPRSAQSRRDEVVHCAGGHVLFRVKRHLRAVALLMPLSVASPAVLEEVKRTVAVILAGNASVATQPTAQSVAPGSAGEIDSASASVPDTATATKRATA